MATHEAARPARRDGEAARRGDDLTDVGAGKVVRPATAPLLDPWLAFVSAGVAASAAGYVATTADTFLGAFRSYGVELPWVTAFVLENASLVPLALIGAAALLLVLGAVRRAPSPHVDVRAATRLLAALVGAAACGCIAANALVFATIQKALQN